MDVYSILIRNIFFPLMERFKGNTIRKKLKFLKDNQHKEITSIEKIQEDELKKLLLFCIHHVPAYHKYKHLEKKINDDPKEALKYFHILEKRDFIQNRDSYKSDNVELSNCILNKTGGSTGEPVSFYMDRETVEWYEAARYLGLSWWDIDIGDRCLMLWASNNDINKVAHFKGYLKELILKNRMIISSWSIDDKNIYRIIKEIKDFNPSYIYAYPSAAYKLAFLLKQKDIKFKLNIKGIVTTAENLYSYQRWLIAEVFKCPVINEYGAKDAGIIAYQCKKGKMHLMPLTGYYEFIDIDGAEDEDKKAILVTDLHNYVMPRLRYKLGDVVTIDKEGCDCGVGFPTIKEIDGRIDEIFVTKNGKIYDCHFFTHLIREMEGILQYQIIQHDIGRFTVKFIKGPKFNEDEVNNFIEKMKVGFGDIDVNISYVDKITVPQSGKVRYFIREFPIDKFNYISE